MTTVSDLTDFRDSARRLIGVSLDAPDPNALFAPPADFDQKPYVDAQSIADDSGLTNHPFFVTAKESPDLLRLWVSQEAMVTGPFTQLLLLAAGQISNVHLRARFMEVVNGEHNHMRDGLALHSHPWLLYQLCNSLGIAVKDVRPLPPTLRFLESVCSEMHDLLLTLGVLGVGNERLLLTEYAAILECFDACLPDAHHEPFLRANITEDTTHSSIIENIAAVYASGDPAALDRYRLGAELGVAARLTYYDDLLEEWNRNGFPPAWNA